MISMTYFPFFKFPLFFPPSLSSQRQWTHVWISECICEHSCTLVCEFVSVCGSPSTNPLENHKKCGEKSVWTKIINIQWWRSDLSLSFSAACLFSEWNQLSSEETPLPLELTTCVTMTTPPLAHLSSFNRSIFPSFHLTKKKAHLIPAKEMSSSHFQLILSF